LHRRRSPSALRRARIAALFVSVVPSVVVFLTWRGAQAAAQTLAEDTARSVEFQLGFGAWLVWASGLLLLWGCARLGIRSTVRREWVVR